MTYYNTRRGVTEEPITVDLIHYRGERLGHLGAFDNMTFTWSDRAAGTTTLTLPLTPLTVLLLPCDGTVLIAARINGKTHLSTVVKATAEGGEDPATATIKITSADGWTLLDGEIWDPPGPTDPENPDENTVTGSLETIIKNLLYVGVTRAGHPVLIAPDQKRGPTVTVTMTRGDNIAEAVQGLLTGTGYRLAMDAWLPGDSPVSGLSPSWPLVVADVVPYRRRDGLIWSAEGRDVPSWSMTQSRATVTDVTVVNKPEKEQNRFSWSASTHPESWWATRCEWLTTDGPKPLGENDLDPFAVQEVLAAEAADHLSQSAAAAELDVEIAPGTTWEFGVDGYTSLQFDVGDYATVTLPVIGNIAQVVTDVEVTITPTEFTVTPTVSTPDTTPVAGFANTTGLDRRLKKIERK